MADLVRVPRLWPGSTVVCVGTGPSLRSDDVNSCRGKARVIVVNDAYKLAPWADAMYAADMKFWKWHKDALAFAGLKYSVVPTQLPGVTSLCNTGRDGLELNPTGLRTGFNSGYQAINLAVHFGATRIVLLGYDMRGDHFFGSHPDKTRPPFAACLGAFASLVAPLTAAGVSIVNCTPGSAITCFPTATLASVLSVSERVA